MPATPFLDGYEDGLHDRQEYSHLYPAGRELEKYEDGRRCGTQDREAGALAPVEAGW